jgi:hypothetical protein
MRGISRLLISVEHKNSSLHTVRSTFCRNGTSHTWRIDTAEILITGNECISAKMDQTILARDGRETGRGGITLNSTTFDCDFWSTSGSFDWSHIPDPHRLLSDAPVNGDISLGCMGVYGLSYSSSPTNEHASPSQLPS